MKLTEIQDIAATEAYEIGAEMVVILSNITNTITLGIIKENTTLFDMDVPEEEMKNLMNNMDEQVRAGLSFSEILFMDKVEPYIEVETAVFANEIKDENNEVMYRKFLVCIKDDGTKVIH